ncbi:MAG TPA: lamin tail domain-containing protein, partial [Polyangiaceae bacterium]
MKNDCHTMVLSTSLLLLIACGSSGEAGAPVPGPTRTNTGGSASGDSSPSTGTEPNAQGGGTDPGTTPSAGDNSGGTSSDIRSTTTVGVAGTSSNTSTQSTGAVSKVIISEIMYHPVDETTAEDEHEFVELYNTSDAELALSGWKLRVGKTDRLTLPATAKIAARGYLVLAKQRDQLLAVTKYALPPDLVVGDFAGGLDNGGAKVAIVDADGV